MGVGFPQPPGGQGLSHQPLVGLQSRHSGLQSHHSGMQPPTSLQHQTSGLQLPQHGLQQRHSGNTPMGSGIQREGSMTKFTNPLRRTMSAQPSLSTAVTMVRPAMTMCMLTCCVGFLHSREHDQDRHSEMGHNHNWRQSGQVLCP